MLENNDIKMHRKNDIKTSGRKFLQGVKEALKTESLRQVIWSDQEVEYRRTGSSDLVSRVIRLPIFFTKENITKAAKAIVAATLKFVDQHDSFPPVMLLLPGKHNYIDGIFDDYPDETKGFIPGQQADLRADAIQIFCDYVAVQKTETDDAGSDHYSFVEQFAFTPQQYADFMLDLLYYLQEKKVEGIGCIMHAQHSQLITISDAISPFLISTPANFYAPETKEEEFVCPMSYVDETGELITMNRMRYGYVLSSEYPLPKGGNPLEGIELNRRDLLSRHIEPNDQQIIWTRLQYTVDHLSKAQSYLRASVETALQMTTYPMDIRRVNIILNSINTGLLQETVMQKISTFEAGLDGSIFSIRRFFEELKNKWILIHGGAKTGNLPEIFVAVSEKTSANKRVSLSLQPTPFNEILTVLDAYKSERDLDKKVDQLHIMKVLLDLLQTRTSEEIMAIKEDFELRKGINTLINLNEGRLQELIETNPRAAQKLLVQLIFFEVEYSNLLGLISQAYGLLSNIKLFQRWQALWDSCEAGYDFNGRILLLLLDYASPGFFRKPNYVTEIKTLIAVHAQKDPCILLSALFDLLTRDFNPDSTLLKIICFILLKTPEACISLQQLSGFRFGLHDSVDEAALTLGKVFFN